MARKTRRRSHRLFGLIGGLTCLAMGAYFAPAIVCNTPLRDHVLDYVLSDFDGTISFQSVSVGWHSPVVLDGVSVTGTDGARLAEVQQIRTQGTLLALVRNPLDLKEVIVTRPNIELRLRPDGSNVEDALAKYLAAESPQDPSATIAGTLRIIDGSLRVEDSTSGRRWQIQKIAALVALSKQQAAPSEANLTAEIVDEVNRASSLAASASWHMGNLAGAARIPLESGSISVKELPLPLIRPALRRFGEDIPLSGQVSIECQLARAGEHAHALQVRSFTANNLMIDTSRWLPDPRLHVPSLRGSGVATLSAQDISLRDVQLESNIFNLAANGRVPRGMAGLQTQPIEPLINPARQASNTGEAARLMTASTTTSQSTMPLPLDACDIRGNVLLAGLARALPRTIRVHDQTQIESGSVAFHLQSQRAGDRQVWNGSLEAADLAAINQGRSIRLSEPVQVSLKMLQHPNSWQLEELRCRSTFLGLLVSGDSRQGSGEIEADFAALKREVGQFIDLDELQLAGHLGGRLQWQSQPGDQLRANAQMLVEGFRFQTPTGQPWIEEQMSVTLDADAVVVGQRCERLITAKAQLISGEDRFSAQLLRPVERPAATSAWPLDAALTGDLSRWATRLRAFTDLDDLTISGQADVQANGIVSSAAANLETARAKITDFKAHAKGVQIDNTDLQLAGDLNWDRSRMLLATRNTTFASSAVAFVAKELSVQLDPRNTSATGTIGFRSDLARLSNWFPGATQNSAGAANTTPRRLAGEMTGQVTLNHSQGVTHAQLNSDIKQLALLQYRNGLIGLGRGWRTVWQEPEVRLDSVCDFDSKTESLIVSMVQLDAGRALQLAANGRISNPRSSCFVDLRGKFAYDLPSLVDKLRPVLGDDLIMTGHEEREFTLQGPLFATKLAVTQRPAPQGPTIMVNTSKPATGSGPLVSDDLTGIAGLGWSSAQYLGLAVGPGEVAARLQNGMLTIDPIQLALNEGQLSLAPRIDLNSTPAALQLAPGRIIDNVRISPEMCRKWMKYIAPIVGDATAAEGRFTLDSDGAVVPLGQPQQSQLRARLMVHQARIGPGPLAQQVLGIARQIKTITQGGLTSALLQGAISAPATASDWLIMPEQTVEIQMAQGLVHHQGLRFDVGEVTLITSGQVSTEGDQPISLVAEVPVSDDWVKNNRWLASYRGQSLRIPITGTTTAPRVDARILGQLSRQALENTGGNLLNEAANKLIEGQGGQLLDDATGGFLEDAAGELFKRAFGSGGQ